MKNVDSKYGAPMGRSSVSLERLQESGGKISLKRIPLDEGGYDSGGAYWGIGAPLFVAQNDEGEEFYFRAPDRETAKTKIARKKDRSV